MFSFCFSIEVGDSHHGPRHRSLMSPKHNRKSLFNNVSSALLSLLKLALPSPSPAAILGISFSFILFRTYTTVYLFWDIFNFSLCFLSSIKTAFNLSKIGHSYTKTEDQAAGYATIPFSKITLALLQYYFLYHPVSCGNIALNL